MKESNLSVQISTKADIWKKIPLWIRSVLTGFTVNSIGVGAWVLLLMTVPSPWFLVVMALFLFVYLKYFSGSWWPVSNSEIRKQRFRKIKLSRAVWIWGLAGALLFVLITQSGLVITFRIMEFPAERFKAAYNLDSLPVGLAWVSLIMASLVAGICEEVGFRGYMQEPLEKRYGPVIGIAIVSAVFVVVHLHQAWAGPVLIHIFVVSALFGILAYKTQSIIPGIIGHTLLDIINFSYWWSDIAGKFERQPIAITGVDVHFITWSLLFSGGLALFFLAMKRLTPVRKEM